jgi:hypothetical protein
MVYLYEFLLFSPKGSQYESYEDMAAKLKRADNGLALTGLAGFIRVNRNGREC